MMRSGLAESVSRRAYWIGVGTLMVLMIILSAWTGMYSFERQEGRDGPAIENVDPVLQMMYTPLGMAIVLLILQFLFANVLFWLGAWLWYLATRRSGEDTAPR
ncbi:hypothetical protein ACERK3_05075 [Phycisphaerales bacterium AB-hyl4]|uniref:Uncharacterized protein n=1 Tax=Natronomicrosphaera hydrolytica TaxID=3242702 RepID=A0ABV4U431_9BACT